MTDAITIRNAGPIESLDIPLPAGGGVVVLRGVNGIGKSVALDSVGALVGGPARVAKRDGTTRGEIAGLGVRVTLGAAQQRRTGGDALEVSAIDGGLDPSLLVDPGLKDPLRADMTRVKVLLDLTGAKAGTADFEHLVGGGDELAQLLGPQAATEADPLQLAQRLKAALEDRARSAEKQATALTARAEGLRAQIGEVDTSVDADAGRLQSAYDVAHEAAVKLQAERSEGLARRAGADAARKNLEAAGPAPSIADAHADVTCAESAHEGAKARLAAAEGEMSRARERLAECHAQLQAAIAARASAERERATREAAERAIQIGAEVSVPDESHITAAIEARNRARAALEQGAVIREAQRKAADLEVLKVERRSLETRAADLRAAARATEDVLSEILARHPATQAFKLREGRLVYPDPKGVREGLVPFGDLSHGEREKIGVGLAMDAVGKGGLFPLRQEAWEALDPVNRADLAARARARGLWIVTAEAAEGALRVEVAP